MEKAFSKDSKPVRKIISVDMDMFYATVKQRGIQTAVCKYPSKEVVVKIDNFEYPPPTQ